MAVGKLAAAGLLVDRTADYVREFAAGGENLAAIIRYPYIMGAANRRRTKRWLIAFWHFVR